MWVCEEYPPDHLLWGRNSMQTVIYLIKYIYFAYSKRFKEGTCLTYFYFRNKCFEQYPDKTTQKNCADFEIYYHEYLSIHTINYQVSFTHNGESKCYLTRNNKIDCKGGGFW